MPTYYDRKIRPTPRSLSWRTVWNGLRRKWALCLELWFAIVPALGVLSYSLIEDPHILRNVMIGVSLVVGFCVLAFVIFQEFLAARVVDPNKLAIHTGLKVYTLPQLPKPRPYHMRNRSSPGDDERFEQFKKCTEHVWFAFCGNRPEREDGHCVLITSGVNGEAKTMLATQLAVRSGQLGISTLLIDADFRRSTICMLLDIPDGTGLSDALQDDKVDSRDLTIPVQGGNFDVLRAGTPCSEPCSVLRYRHFGSMIAHLRKFYDLIIIDTPPILPVPDALIVGRWADSAILTTRRDISRFPEINRALHQLDNAGITVLGIVLFDF